MSDCSKFVALLSVLCTLHLHGAQQPPAGAAVVDTSIPASCVQTFQKLESLRKNTVSLNIEGGLGGCTAVATWEELIAAIRGTASVAPPRDSSSGTTLPVVLLLNSISAPDYALTEKVIIHRPFILAGQDSDVQLHRLEFPLATGLEVAEGAAEKIYIVVYNLHLPAKESLSLEDLSLVPQNNAMLPNAPGEVSVISESVSFVDSIPDDLSAFDLSQGFDPAELPGGFLDPSALQVGGGGMIVMEVDLRYVAVIMLDAKISIPATSAASFTSRTSNRMELSEYSKWGDITPWQHAFLTWMLTTTTEGVDDGLSALFPGEGIPGKAATPMKALNSPSGQVLVFRDTIYLAKGTIMLGAFHPMSFHKWHFLESVAVEWPSPPRPIPSTIAPEARGGQGGGGSVDGTCQTTTGEIRGRDYTGPIAKSASGKDCLPWQDVAALLDTKLGIRFKGLEGNACRNPADHAAVWCFVEPDAVPSVGTTLSDFVDYMNNPTSFWEWEHCNVPACELQEENLNCYKKEDWGESYRAPELVFAGFLAEAAPCLPWAEVDKHLFGHIPGSACRNPFGAHAKPWCFTKDFGWQYCDVPECGELDKAAAPSSSGIPFDIIVAIMAAASLLLAIFAGCGVFLVLKRRRKAQNNEGDVEDSVSLVGTGFSFASKTTVHGLEGKSIATSSTSTSSTGKIESSLTTDTTRSSPGGSQAIPAGSVASLGQISFNGSSICITTSCSVIYSSAAIAQFLRTKDDNKLATMALVLATLQMVVWRQILAILACGSGNNRRTGAPAGMGGVSLPFAVSRRIQIKRSKSLGPGMLTGTEIDCMELFHGQLSHVLGHGATATVYKTVWNGKEVAVKVFSVSPTSRESSNTGLSAVWNDKLKRQAFLAELWIMQDVAKRCDRIVKMLAHCPEPEHPCIIYEYMNGGTLSDYLTNNESTSVVDALLIVRDIAEGLAHLHPGVIHRDLKPENVLMHDGRAKVADLGLGQLKDPMNTYLDASPAGTISYMAPEAFKRGKITHRSDIYSLGVILNEVLTHTKPWPTEYTPYQVMFAVSIEGKRPEMPQHCSEGVRRLINKCWAQEERKRPAAAEVCKMIDMLIDQHRVALPGGTYASPW